MNHTLEHVYKHTGIYIVKKRSSRWKPLEMPNGGAIHNVSTNNNELFGNLNYALHGISRRRPRLPRVSKRYTQESAPAVFPKSSYRSPSQDRKDGERKVVKKEPNEIIDLTLNYESEDSVDDMDIEEPIDFIPQRKTHHCLPMRQKDSTPTPEDGSRVYLEDWGETATVNSVERKYDDIIDLTDEDRSVEGESDTSFREDIGQFRGTGAAIEHDVRCSAQVEVLNNNRLTGEPKHDVGEMGATQSASSAAVTDLIGLDSQPDANIIEDVNAIYNLFEAHIQGTQAEISAYENESVAARETVDSHAKRTAFALQHFSDLFIEQQAFRDQIEEYETHKIKDVARLLEGTRKTLTNLKIAYIVMKAQYSLGIPGNSCVQSK